VLLPRQSRRAHRTASIISAHFSPIMMPAALVLPEAPVGMIEASATRRPERRWMRSSGSIGRGVHHAGAARVEDGRAAGARVGEQVVVGDLVGARLDLLGDVGLERLRGREAARCGDRVRAAVSRTSARMRTMPSGWRNPQHSRWSPATSPWRPRGGELPGGS
jgi:hypothetical protein